jgi:penicillin-binding protein-related factor A (putative recombinase)
LPHIKHYTLLLLTLHITLKWITHNTKKLTHHANTRYKGLASMNVETASQCFKVDFKPPINFWKCVCEEEQMRKTLLLLTLHIQLKWITHNTKKLTHHAKTSNTRYKGLASMNVETASQCFKVDFKPPINFWKCVCEEEQMRKKGQHTWFYNAKFW